jgi:adenylate cyclase
MPKRSVNQSATLRKNQKAVKKDTKEVKNGKDAKEESDENPWLVIRKGPHEGTRLPLSSQNPIVIGRSSSSQLDCSHDRTISRIHFQIDYVPPQCWITNASFNGTRVNGIDVIEAELRDGDKIAIGSTLQFEIEMPQAQAADSTSHRGLRTLGSADMKNMAVASLRFSQGTIGSLDSFSKMLLPVIRSLERVMNFFQTSISSTDFFSTAAKSVVDVVGLDTGRIVLYEDGKWVEAVVESSPHITEVVPFSKTIMNQVRLHKSAFWYDGTQELAELSVSADLIDAVVAAPIMNENKEIIGAVYGDRSVQSMHDGDAITEWEAMLVELLACGVASGLQRNKQLDELAAQQSRFEQFQTKKLAEQLELDPGLLDGRDAVVTTMFCDVRKFSKISEKLGTSKTFSWINDVMDVLSECVMEFDGVIVDYIGDELMAMWGAPVKQDDHAQLACSTAKRMLERLPEIDAKWEPIVGQTTDVGIGINTGAVRAGNTGSRHKFKYGPLGHSVNLASRVQGATKYLMSRVLITGETRQSLDDSFTGRRLCDVRVVNIAQPVSIYELRCLNADEQTRLIAPYEKALSLFESNQYRQAAGVLTRILNDYPDDGPSLLLLSRTVNAMTAHEDVSHVWELPGK